MLCKHICPRQVLFFDFCQVVLQRETFKLDNILRHNVWLIDVTGCCYTNRLMSNIFGQAKLSKR